MHDCSTLNVDPCTLTIYAGAIETVVRSGLSNESSRCTIIIVDEYIIHVHLCVHLNLLSLQTTYGIKRICACEIVEE